MEKRMRTNTCLRESSPHWSWFAKSGTNWMVILFLTLSSSVSAFVPHPRRISVSVPNKSFRNRFNGNQSRHDNNVLSADFASSNVLPNFASFGYGRRTCFLRGKSSGTEDELLLEEIRGMRVRQLKDELKSINVRTDDVFEKEELVQRLFDARLQQSTTATTAATSTSTTTKTPRKTNSNQKPQTIRVPLHFYSLETGSKPVSARTTSASLQGEPVYLRPSPGKFACIRLSLLSPSQTNNNNDTNTNGNGHTLTLLVDTACSGIVLRPSAVQTHNLPSYSSPSMTMTAAGGTAAGGTIAQLHSRFALEDGTEFDARRYPAAVQDIGAMPSPIDGIVGLSFLREFDCVDFDFDAGELVLMDGTDGTDDGGDGLGLEVVVAQGDMALTRLGIYMVQATLDGRGPVRMLVDTGAASTFLNWDGAEQMNIRTKDHPLLSRNTNALGAMGADNVALELTHRFVLKRRFNFAGGVETGLFLPGLDIGGGGGGGESYSLNPLSDDIVGNSDESNSVVNVDIGNLPVLDQLRSDGVGGILGSDLLMRCDVLRLKWSKNSSSFSSSSSSSSTSQSNISFLMRQKLD